MDFNDLNEKFMTARTGKLNEAEGEVEIAYHIPGKGGWNRKTFKSQEEMQKWTAKLRDKEGDDVEIRTRTNEKVNEDQGRDQAGKFSSGGGKPASEPKDKDWAKKLIAKKFGKDAPELQKGYKGSHGDPETTSKRGDWTKP